MIQLSKIKNPLIKKSTVKGKKMDEMMIGTRNKLIVYYSKLFGNARTNELINEAFSKSKPIQKIIEAEKMGFETVYIRDNLVGKGGKDKYVKEEGVFLRKDIPKDSLDVAKYNEKFYNTLKDNLLLLYNEELTNAIMGHYLPEMYTYLCSSSNLEIPYVLITEVLGEVEEDGTEISSPALSVELSLSGFLRDSNIEKDDGDKIIKYKTNGEEIAGVFIDTLIHVFGKAE